MTYLDINKIIGKNLRRMRERAGMSQIRLAEIISTTPQRLSAYETGRDGMGKEYMERVCKALNVEPWEFFFSDTMPLLKDDYEREMVEMGRRAKEAGVAEEIMRYGEYRIADAQVHGNDLNDRLRRGKEALRKKSRKKKAAS